MKHMVVNDTQKPVNQTQPLEQDSPRELLSVEERVAHFFERVTVGKILAITVPVSAMLTSMSWAISSYFMVRERERRLIELARLEARRQR